MSTGDLIRTIIETVIVVFTVWGIFNENRFIAFEDKIAAHFRRKRLRVIKGAEKSF